MKTIALLSSLLLCMAAGGQNPVIEDLWKLYQAREYDKVIESAKPLLEIDSLKVEMNLLTGRCYADKGDYQLSIPYLSYTASNDYNNTWRKAWALGYLGTSYFMLQDYESSKKALKECLGMKATRNITNFAYGKILVFGYDDFYNDWKIEESDNFRFHFQNMTDPDIEKFISTREEAFQKINKFFSSDMPVKIAFFVWDSQDDAMEVLRTNLGFADPQHCVVHSHYQQTPGHEMTHVISNYCTKITAKTRFINEGTAVCFDQTNPDRLKSIKDWALKNNKEILIKDLWEQGEKYGEEILYPVAGLFVQALIENFGREKFIEFFGNQTYSNAKSVFGDKLDRVIEEFDRLITS